MFNFQENNSSWWHNQPYVCKLFNGISTNLYLSLNPLMLLRPNRTNRRWSYNITGTQDRYHWLRIASHACYCSCAEFHRTLDLVLLFHPYQGSISARKWMVCELFFGLSCDFSPLNSNTGHNPSAWEIIYVNDCYGGWMAHQAALKNIEFFMF